MAAIIDKAMARRRSARRRPSRLGVADLVWLTAALALASSLAGLMATGVYAGPRSTAETLRGYDLVTAVLVAPTLLVASAYVRRGSSTGRLVAAGLLADLVYSYGYYVFGTAFGPLLLLHVGVFAASLATLVVTIAGLDVRAAGARRFDDQKSVWLVAVSLGVLAASLGGMWVAAGIDNAITGTVPVGSRLVETPGMVHLGLVLDLAVQVPLYSAAAVLVWRRASWGYVFAFVALLSGIPEQVSYLVAMPFQVGAGVPGAVSFDPLEPVIAALYLVGFVSLLLPSRESRP